MCIYIGASFSCWIRFNGDIIPEYVTSLRGVNGEISSQRYGGSLVLS